MNILFNEYTIIMKRLSIYKRLFSTTLKFIHSTNETFDHNSLVFEVQLIETLQTPSIY